MSIRIRREKPSDVMAIESLIGSAFRNARHAGRTEQLIVRALRNDGQLSISLVAEENGAIVGHVAVSPVSISDDTDGWYGLGPIAVAPACQGRGIGGQLTLQALAQLHTMGAAGCVVLGDPDYYGRFGFRAEPTLVLPDVPAEYFQSIAFAGSVPSGNVSYHEAFNVQADNGLNSASGSEDAG
ncbi:MAG: N-acetyltransferase [Ectothiorhodospiraceae bacterium]|nr:N-acetyltransferase [Ectothiorhodospiraceae bacterium]